MTIFYIRPATTLTGTNPGENKSLIALAVARLVSSCSMISGMNLTESFVSD